MIKTAVVQNYYVRLAVVRIEKAQAHVGISKAIQNPLINSIVVYNTRNTYEYAPIASTFDISKSSNTFDENLQAIF